MYIKYMISCIVLSHMGMLSDGIASLTVLGGIPRVVTVRFICSAHTYGEPHQRMYVLVRHERKHIVLHESLTRDHNMNSLLWLVITEKEYWYSTYQLRLFGSNALPYNAYISTLSDCIWPICVIVDRTEYSLYLWENWKEISVQNSLHWIPLNIHPMCKMIINR